MTETPIENYKRYCRPVLAEILKALRIDKVYHRAHGDSMFYDDGNGNEVEVVDFLGGFGASLFGHNHPDIVGAVMACYQNGVPFNSQVSCRKTAASMCGLLNEIMYDSVKKNFVTTLANTGTEAVEAAMKHAEFAAFRRIEGIRETIRKSIVEILKDYKAGKIIVSKEFDKRVEELTGHSAGTDLGKKLWAIRSLNHLRFQSEPFFLSLEKSFHGKTSGSVQLTHYEEYRRPFHRIGPNVIFIEPGCIKSLSDAVQKAKIHYFMPAVDENGVLRLDITEMVNISAMFIEPLQGEGGINVIPGEYIELCRNVSTEHGFHLVFDEIQSGMGRTGTFLFSEQCGVTADYYLLAKSLGGGVAKISALLVDEALYEPDFGRLHTSTFAEDDHSAAAGLAALRLLKQNPWIMDHCREKGELLTNGLLKIKDEFPGVIKSVRGKGLMLGIRMEKQHDQGHSHVIATMSSSNMLCAVIAGHMLNVHRIRLAPALSANNTLRLEPSAFISESECLRFLDAFRSVCEMIYKHNSAELTGYIAVKKPMEGICRIKDFRAVPIHGAQHSDIPKVAFIGHLIEAKHIKLRDRSFENLTDEQCFEFLKNIYPFTQPQVDAQQIITSRTGEKVRLNFIGLGMDSSIIGYHMLSGDIAPVHLQIEKAVDLAVDLGCQAVGFGGFTSIVTQNCKSIVTDSIALTTGNSFTVAMGIEAFTKATEDMGIDIENACLASIGAGGNICSVYSEIMAEKVPKIILIGRQGGRRERLEEVAAEIYAHAYSDIVNSRRSGAVLSGVAREIADTLAVKTLLESGNTNGAAGKQLYKGLALEMKDRAPVKISTDIHAIKHADLIIGSSNSVQPIIFPSMLGDRPVIINDIAVPQDVDDSVQTERPDVMVIQGGIVKLPNNPEFMISGIPLSPGHSFACMAETTLLGLTDISKNYSYGRITKAQVKKIWEIANIHGYSLGEFKVGRSY